MWTPQAAGAYELHAWVRNNGVTADTWQAWGRLVYTVTAATSVPGSQAPDARAGSPSRPTSGESWAMVASVRISAWVITSSPARVTGAVKPAMGWAWSHDAGRRLSGARDEGIRTLVTACPNCRTVFERAAEKYGIDIGLVDIVELFMPEKVVTGRKGGSE